MITEGDLFLFFNRNNEKFINKKRKKLLSASKKALSEG